MPAPSNRGGKMAKGKDASLAVARLEAKAAYQLAAELANEVSVAPSVLDEEMILPLAKEIQAKVQSVANRVEAFVADRDAGS